MKKILSVLVAAMLVMMTGCGQKATTSSSTNTPGESEDKTSSAQSEARPASEEEPTGTGSPDSDKISTGFDFQEEVPHEELSGEKEDVPRPEEEEEESPSASEEASSKEDSAKELTAADFENEAVEAPAPTQSYFSDIGKVVNKLIIENGVHLWTMFDDDPEAALAKFGFTTGVVEDFAIATSTWKGADYYAIGVVKYNADKKGDAIAQIHAWWEKAAEGLTEPTKSEALQLKTAQLVEHGRYVGFAIGKAKEQTSDLQQAMMTLVDDTEVNSLLDQANSVTID